MSAQPKILHRLASERRQALTFRALDDKIRERGNANYAKIKTEQGWAPVTWRQFRRGYLHTAALLQRLHPERPPVVGILAATRLEWNLCDFATLALGGVTVGFYGNDRDEVIQHILNEALPDILVLENLQALRRIQALDPAWGTRRPVVLIDRDKAAGEDAAVYPLADCRKLAEDSKLEAAIETSIANLREDQVASYIFTSGTSGLPKAAVLTQKNLFHTAEVYYRHYPLSDTDETLLYLPLAHVFARVMYYAGIHWGVVPYYSRIEDLVSDFTQVHPSVVLVVPRLLEKVRSKVLDKVASGSRLSRWLFAWATRVGHCYNVQRQRGVLTRLQIGLAERLVLDKVARLFGDRLRFLGCGGGHLPRAVADFFLQFGIPVYEGYATTESGGLGVFNFPGSLQLGAVGQPVAGVEVRLADDGEIQLRSDSNFQGYLRDERATQEVLEDGWLKTGDIGQLDGQGFLSIVDRKKDLFVTAYGKNVAPSYLEEKLLSSPAIEDAVVCGDGAAYLVALIVPNESLLQRYCNGLQDPELYQLIEDELERINQRLSRHETIRRFCLVPFFDVASGTVTSTFKKRRKAIQDRYRGEISALYELDASTDGRLPLATVS